jgi:hypothetical protein
MNYYVMRSYTNEAIWLLKMNHTVAITFTIRHQLNRSAEATYGIPLAGSCEQITQAEWESWCEMELFPAFEAYSVYVHGRRRYGCTMYTNEE